MGFVLASISSVLSAGGSFLAGRYLSRGWMLEKIALNEKIRAVDDAVSQEGWKMVALLRLTSIVPFSAMNYGLGLSRIRFRPYLLASWLGMMPGTLLYVYLGSLAGHLAGAGRPEKLWAEWALSALGLLVTVWVSVRATQIVRNALKTAG
jgi:uncharacterized membrane protein YdjX (TVP38/TMEM64 family)